ncbi:hypothetical protein L2E82_14067 [Cichorium intybus]|uniref:Uncharacterized protein n=1 Tax=Cichorium intybus TaxID=13427 RepID=A0ACB9F084_CICIN|nr:hypothetical protein L2E82_14067 [Cichorium intybus]
MGCLLCCFRVPEVDQQHEGPDDGQHIQQPNETTNRSTQDGLSSFVQDIANECDALFGKGAKGVNHSQVEPEVVLESNNLIRQISEDLLLIGDDECLICFEGDDF